MLLKNISHKERGKKSSEGWMLAGWLAGKVGNHIKEKSMQNYGI